jgi:WD40 repeat protein
LGPTKWVEGVVFTPDGKTALAAGGINNSPGELHAWNVERRGWSVKDAHEQGAFAAVWSPNGKELITGSYDGAIKFWSAATGEEKAKFTAEQGGVRALAVSKDGKWLASGGHDGTVKLWDLTDDKDATELTKFDKVVNSVAFSPDGKLLAACCADPYNRDKTGAVKVIDIDTGREKAGEWKNREAMSVVFSPNGKTLATGSIGARGIVLYDVASGKQSRRALDRTTGVFALEYSKDGARLAAALGSGNVEVRDTRTWGPPVVCSGHTALCPALALSPDGLSMASASHDKTVKVFDLRKGQVPAGPAMMARPQVKE